MRQHPPTYTLLLLFICCISCNQNKTAPPSDNTNEQSILSEVSTGLKVTREQAKLKQYTETKDTTAPNSITRTIKQDRNGNIWLATWEGIIRYDGTSFTNITSEVSLSRFFSVLEDRKGNFWFASIGAGVYYYDGKTFQNFTTKEGLVNDRVTHIYEDKKGNIWFGTEGGASCYDGKSFRNFSTKDGLPHNDVNAIIEDKTGKFWFGTRGAACFYDGKTFTKITNKDGTTFTNVRSIIEDKKGNIWLGGNDGLWRYDGSNFTQFSPQFVGYIYEDKKGNLWTSSESNGQGWVLSRYEEQSLSTSKARATQVKTHGGMFFGILEDSDGNIWLGTLKGVYRYNGSTFTDFKNPK